MLARPGVVATFHITSSDVRLGKLRCLLHVSDAHATLQLLFWDIVHSIAVMPPSAVPT